MLQNTQIRPAIALAERLDQMGIYLAPELGTPLHALVSTLGLSQTDVIPVQNNLAYTPNAQFYLDQSKSWGAGIKRGEAVPHNEELERLFKPIAVAVRAHLNFARSVAKPVQTAVYEEYTKLAKGYTIDPTQNTTIKVVDLPDPIKDPSLLETIKEFSSKPFGELINTLFMLSPLSVAEVRELATKGYSGSGAMQWLQKLPDVFVQEVWETVFEQTPSDVKSNFRGNFQTLKMGPEGASVCMLVWLLSNSLIDNPPSGVNVSLSAYNTLMSGLRNQAALFNN